MSITNGSRSFRNLDRVRCTGFIKIIHHFLNFKIRNNLLFYAGEKMWRDDGRCGPGYHLNNTNIIAQCNPDLGKF